jgi:Lipocalin-like domain
MQFLPRIQLILLFFVLIRCSSDDIKPKDIEGKWLVTTMQSKIESKSSGKSDDTETLKGIYIQFNTDNTFESNTKFSALDQSLSQSAKLEKGTYSIKGNKILLKQYDIDFDADATTQFTLQNVGESSAQLVMDKNDLLETLSGIMQLYDKENAGIMEVIIESLKEDFTAFGLILTLEREVSK